MTYKQINREINKFNEWMRNIDLNLNKLQSYNDNIKYWKGLFLIKTGELKWPHVNISQPIIEEFKLSEIESFRIKVIQELMK